MIFSTDALERSLAFVDSLEDRMMTSTTARLATVQRAIETLTLQLSGDQQVREQAIRDRIATLQEQLAAVRSGQFQVPTEAEAAKGIREVHQLATSLRSDFRRVEDSFQAADRTLR